MTRPAVGEYRQLVDGIYLEGLSCDKEGKPLTDASYLYRSRSATPRVALAPTNFRLGQA